MRPPGTRHGPGLLLAAWMATAGAAAAPPGPERQAELHRLLIQDCGSCHGLRLKGGLGPPLLPEAIAARPDDLLVQTILEGREGTPMPPWKPFLSPGEAAWLVRELRRGVRP